MSEFIHLHNHSHYSILDAIATPEELVKAAAANEMKAIALTDHGVMFGLMEFQKFAKSNGVKPLFGMEAYIANGSRFDRIQTKKNEGRRNYFHLLLLAKDVTGYKNLVKLTSYAHTEGFYYRPRIDKELLEKYKDGLIVASACLGGVVSAHLIDGNYERAVAESKYYRDVFGDDFYLELQDHNYLEDKIILDQVPKIANELGIKMIATNDIHYMKKEHALAHNLFLMIKDTNSSNADQADITKLRYKTDEFYFRSTEEMKALFKEYPEAISNTVEIADKCNLKLNFPINMPDFSIPKESDKTNFNEYLEEIVWKGINEKYPVITDEIKKRVEYELSIITKMGFANYFLVVNDFISAARKRGIRVGPGRGSAAGSIIAYALEITGLDPLEGNLLFERFLNPERVSMPDIDIDFDDEKREQVIQYCQEKYGSSSVAQIATFGRLSSRMVLKDVGRVLNIPLSEINRMTSKIPVQFGKVMKIKDAMNLADLKYVKDSNDDKIKKLIEFSLILEDKNRSIGTHAAGVVITPTDTTDYVPIIQNTKATSDSVSIATQYTMNFLEDAGVIKMDFLGLRTLSMIERALVLIKKNKGIDVDIDKVDLTDQKTYDLIGEGKTLAVFQFESNGMQEYLRKLKPQSLEDLTAMNALYRPGPMSNIPSFIDRKLGKQQITYLHPLMESVLKNTYGIIVYQEQVMQLVQKVANFSLGEADILRRSMGKKQKAEIDKLKPKFLEGAESNGVNQKIATDIFELIEKFADYGFNKSHSYVYSYIAFQTAYLKAHYPAEFLASNMTAELNSQETIVELIDEAKTFGIELLPPDINKSEAAFTVKGNTIYFGLAAVKGIGVKPVEHIVEVRSEKPFESYIDFVKRTDSKHINRRVLEGLIFAGAFDSVSGNKRRALFESIDNVLNFAKSQLKNEGMTDLFAAMGKQESAIEPKLPNVKEWSERERLDHEKDVLNFYVSGHPLKEFSEIVKSFSNTTISKFKINDEIFEKSYAMPNETRFCGLISSVRTRRDKQNRMIAFAIVEDFYGKVECIFWSEAYAKFEHLLIESSTITVFGKVDVSDESSIKIVVSEAYSFIETIEKFTSGIVINLDETKLSNEDMLIIRDTLEIDSSGNNKLIISLENSQNKTVNQFISYDNKINLNKINELKKLSCFKNYQYLTM